MLPDAWFQLRPHHKQNSAWNTKSRFINLACGRGSGKTEIARRKIVTQLPLKKPWSDPLYFYALPTFAQAKRVAWTPIRKLIPKEWIVEENVSDMRIETIFGSTLYVVGTDQPQRLEGVQWDFGIMDEACDCKPGVFERSIRPALSHRAGCLWRIGVPKRYGIGAADFKKVFDMGLASNEVSMESYSWPSADILPPAEIYEAKKLLTSEDFREQFEASWESAGGLIFYNFNYSTHTKGALGYNPNLPIYIGMDFNVDPMAWVIGHIIGTKEKELHVFDEMYIRDTHTPQALDELWGRYGDHKAGWVFTGDASSRQRKTSAALTDYIHIQNDKRFENKRVYIPKSNPGVNDRFSACNALLKNAESQVRLLISPKCKHLIRDLEVRAYKEGTRLVDDTNPDIGHISDGLGYLIWREFPIPVTSNSRPALMSRSF